MFRFESPTLLQLLWIIPVLVILTVGTARWASRQLAKAFGARLYPFLTSSVSSVKRRWRLFLRACVLFLMIVAWARPQAGQSKQEVKSEGVELMLVVDVSESMMAEDLRPSRLQQAKTDLSRLLDLMPGNKVGVVAFAGSSVLLSPLSTDPNAVKMYLDSLSPLSVSTQGTDFKSALSEAKEALERGGVGNEGLVRATRVILMASDGEDHEPGALDMAKDLTKKGIRIFTVAYGTEKGAPIPERDSLGYLRGYKKDHSGQTILTTVKGEALRILSQAGQGSFYFATPSGDHLKQIVEDINKLEKTQFESEMAVQYDEKFQVVLLLAFVLGLLEIFLGDRRSSFRLWKGRFEVPPA